MKRIERQAVRAILLTPEREVLLMQIRNPMTKADFWICPGGGRNPDEEEADCLARELREELGLNHFEAQHRLHRRHHTFTWKDKRISQHEVFYLVRVKKFTPVITDPVEAEVVQEFRWWPLAELNSSAHPITPTRLPEIIRAYMENGPPLEPLALEEQVD